MPLAKRKGKRKQEDRIKVPEVMKITGLSASRVSQLRESLGVLPERDDRGRHGRLYSRSRVVAYRRKHPPNVQAQIAGRAR